MTNKVDPIQELVANARRTQILDAATSVFAQKGFHRATVKDIAQEAGIADGTLYTYFKSKNDLLIGILERLNQTPDRQQHFEFGSEQEFIVFFKAYLRQRLSLLQANAETFRAILPELLVSKELQKIYRQQVLVPTFAVAEQYFEQEAKRGNIRKMEIPLMARTLAATTLGFLILYLLDEAEVSSRWDELVNTLTDLMYNGMKKE